MIKRTLTLLSVLLINLGTCLAQNTTSVENETYQNVELENLLDGFSMNFHYHNGGAIHIEFYDGKVKYVWVAGPAKGNSNKDITYRSRRIGDDLYLVNWHETGKKDYMTFIFDFKNMVMYNSVILGYENNPDRPRRTLFNDGIIDTMKRPE
jgi:hypothetical protein